MGIHMSHPTNTHRLRYIHECGPLELHVECKVCEKHFTCLKDYNGVIDYRSLAMFDAEAAQGCKSMGHDCTCYINDSTHLLMDGKCYGGLRRLFSLYFA